MVIETGLSDFDKMSATVMKMYYTKQKASMAHYRKFKNFCNNPFVKILHYFCQSCVINKMFRLKY